MAGSGHIAALIGRRPLWRRRLVESDYELRLEQAGRRRGFPLFQRQCRLELSTGEACAPRL
jgi:hypothetical protein